MQSRPRFCGIAAAGTIVCSVAALNGCAAMLDTNDSPFGTSRSPDVTLSVVNRNVENVRVYMLRETVRIPLGTVDALGSRVFKISSTKLGVRRVLWLKMETAASYASITMLPVDVEPGQQVEAMLGTYLNNSNVFVRTH